MRQGLGSQRSKSTCRKTGACLCENPALHRSTAYRRQPGPLRLRPGKARLKLPPTRECPSTISWTETPVGQQPPPTALASTVARLPLPPTGSIRPWLLLPAGRPASDPHVARLPSEPREVLSTASATMLPGPETRPLLWAPKKPTEQEANPFGKDQSKTTCSPGPRRSPNKGQSGSCGQSPAPSQAHPCPVMAPTSSDT